MDDWLLRLLRRFGRPRQGVPKARINLDAVDSRLTEIEHRTDDLAARMELVERQTNPRGIFRNRHDG